MTKVTKSVRKELDKDNAVIDQHKKKFPPKKAKVPRSAASKKRKAVTGNYFED